MPNSPAWFDRLTFTDEGGRTGATGSWYALLTMGGSAEMLRGLCVLFEQSLTTPLTRAHMPLARSLQEHLGRVVWLCEPGFTEAEAADAAPDAWEQRHLRALLMAAEWASEQEANLALNDPDVDDVAAAKIEAARLRGNAKALAARLRIDLPDPQSPTNYAVAIEVISARVHSDELRMHPQSSYKTFSETTHGGLVGLHSDSTLKDSGRLVFEQDNQGLDAIASRVGWWWASAVWMLGRYYGWDVDAALEPFEDLWAALYPEEGEDAD
ncbi:MAG: hypothetical protein JWP32_2516 [Schumannella sp.]|nr:hypothetical protein [Schumannella sp.]